MAMTAVRIVMTECIPAVLAAVCDALVRVRPHVGVRVLDAAVAVAVAF
jgi:hypothetical protein